MFSKLSQMSLFLPPPFLFWERGNRSGAIVPLPLWLTNVIFSISLSLLHPVECSSALVSLSLCLPVSVFGLNTWTSGVGGASVNSYLFILLLLFEFSLLI